MREPGAGSGGDRGPGLRLAVEGIGAGVVLVAAVRVLAFATEGAGVETILGVLAPAYVLLEILVLAALLVASGERGARERLAALDLRPGWIAFRQGLLVGMVGLLGLGLLSGLLDVSDRTLTGAGRSALAFVRSHPWSTLAVVTVGGALEEVVFRGWGVLLVRRARPSLTLPALAASSLLFGAGHVYAPAAGLLAYSLLGLVFGCVALAAGSVVPGLVLHGAVNALVTAAVVFGG